MVEMVYDDGSEPAYRDYGQLDNAPDGIPARDVDAALRRIEEAADLASEWFKDCPRDDGDQCFLCDLHDVIREERRKLGLPAEVKI